MRKFGILVLVLCQVFVFRLVAQDNVGIGTNTPHSSALLDLTATDKGLLVPRVSLIALNDGINPINTPETGLLVYNIGGALAEGFYYWDSSQWVMVGAGGSSCHTLDESYDCGGAGAGALIVADANAVTISLPAAAANDNGLYVQSDKGTDAAPTAAIAAVNTMFGAGIYAEITETTNLYSGIQGITNTSLTGSDLATGISGYHEGSGIGVGVWGEAGSDNAAGASYGVYGKGVNKSFGGYFFGENWPGGFVETGDASGAALQVAAAGLQNVNPALLTVGWVQFGCGNSGAAAGYDILFNNASGEATIAPDNGGWGYLGGAGLEWWGVYTSNSVQVSRRNLKRNITYFDDNISNYVMSDIMKLKPVFYKYKSENDQKISGRENRTRYNMHLGFILDETPDYVQDNAFSGIDLYGLISLGIAGVQENHRAIERIETSSVCIQDFGIAEIDGVEIRVEYEKDFFGEVPVVSITPLASVSGYYLKSLDETGFVLAVSENANFKFNWIAIAESKLDLKSDDVQIDPELEAQLEVDETKKKDIHNELFIEKVQTVDLKGKNSKNYNTKKMNN